MGGYGSTIGGLVGMGAGAYFGGPAGASAGASVGGALGSGAGGSIEGMFGGGNEPKQTATQMTSYDPYAHFKPELGVIESALKPRLSGSVSGQVRYPGSVGNLYVPPSQQQTGALGSIEEMAGEARPAFSAGTGQLMQTIAGRQDPTGQGQYLDVMGRPEFQRLSDARLNMARQMFGEFAPQYRSSSGGRGMSSSSREAGVQRGAERIGSQAAQDIATAGWGQYGSERQLMEAARARERAAQEAAIRTGLETAPGLAGQVFTGAEQLRAAEQAAGTAQAEINMRGQIAAMEGSLRAAGMDEDRIRTVLEYMKLRALQPVNPIVGKSPEEIATQRNAGMGGMLSGLVGPMSRIFGKDTSGGIPTTAPSWSSYGDPSAGYNV
jgi:hypothetical protein